jgi:hypothetical protein
MAPPPARPALGALFLVLAILFAGIAAASAEAINEEPLLVVVTIAAAVIALWLLTLALHNLKRANR